MAIRETPIINGEYYHLYNRGNSKQAIFFDDEDYDRFTKLLFICNSRKSINFRTDLVERRTDAWEFDRGEPIVSICSWVLMSNHFHLYLKAGNENDDKNMAILFMHKIGTAYVKYLNAKYERTGSLFEGKFKSVHITNDNQARYLFSYIHLNPVKLIQSDWKEKGIKDKVKAFNYAVNFKHSSLQDWLGPARKENLILNKQILNNILPENFSPHEDIFQWLSYRGEEIF